MCERKSGKYTNGERFLEFPPFLHPSACGSYQVETDGALERCDIGAF
jgi:hypothetical protein